MVTRTSVRGVALVLIAFGLTGILSITARADNPTRRNTAVRPVPRDPGWMKRHEQFVAIARKGEVNLLFLGDSITDAWGGEAHDPKASGAKIFSSDFAPHGAANFGIGGDRTQHVLWRLQNGELEGIKPKVVMLMIGTNNSGARDNNAEEIAEGITAIVQEIKRRTPTTKILLLGIFPRGEKPNPQRDKLKKVNALISKLDDGGKTVQYLDIGDKFMEPDGTISRKIMPDSLHLSARGYEIWADAVKRPIHDLAHKE